MVSKSHAVMLLIGEKSGPGKKAFANPQYDIIGFAHLFILPNWGHQLEYVNELTCFRKPMSYYSKFSSYDKVSTDNQRINEQSQKDSILDYSWVSDPSNAFSYKVYIKQASNSSES